MISRQSNFLLLLLILVFPLFVPERAEADILDFLFKGQTENKGEKDITNMNGESLDKRLFEFRFQVDKSQLSDSDSRNNQATFLNGLTKGFFKIGADEGGLYEGQGDLTDYEINIQNDGGGGDKFEIRLNNFFGDDVNKNHKSYAPKDLTITLKDQSGTVFDQDPTVENFPDFFDIEDWSGATFAIEWKSGTKIDGSFHALSGGSAVPEPSHYFSLLVLTIAGYFLVQRSRSKTRKATLVDAN